MIVHNSLYMCFVHLKKVYDTLNRDALWSVLQERYSPPAKVVRILWALHETTEAVRAYERVSGNFQSGMEYDKMYLHLYCSIFS